MIGVKLEHTLAELVAAPASSVARITYFSFDGIIQSIDSLNQRNFLARKRLTSRVRKNTPDSVLRCSVPPAKLCL